MANAIAGERLLLRPYVTKELCDAACRRFRNRTASVSASPSCKLYEQEADGQPEALRRGISYAMQSKEHRDFLGFC